MRGGPVPISEPHLSVNPPQSRTYLARSSSENVEALSGAWFIQLICFYYLNDQSNKFMPNEQAVVRSGGGGGGVFPT